MTNTHTMFVDSIIPFMGLNKLCGLGLSLRGLVHTSTLLDLLPPLWTHHCLYGIMVIPLSFYYYMSVTLSSQGMTIVHKHSLIQRLAKAFAMKDLGPLHYFLGLEVSRSTDGIFLSQIALQYPHGLDLTLPLQSIKSVNLCIALPQLIGLLSKGFFTILRGPSLMG